MYKLGVEVAVESSVGTDSAAEPNFVLTPLFPDLPGSNKSIITISYSELQNSIYAPTFKDDANGFASSYLLSGFDAGLWGARAAYTNPNTTHSAVNKTGETAKIELSNSWNWPQFYNYDGAAAKAQGVTSINVDNVLQNATHDKYAAAICGVGKSLRVYVFRSVGSGWCNPRTQHLDGLSGG